MWPIPMTATRTDVTSDVQVNFRIVVMSEIAHRPPEPPDRPSRPSRPTYPQAIVRLGWCCSGVRRDWADERTVARRPATSGRSTSTVPAHRGLLPMALDRPARRAPSLPR